MHKSDRTAAGCTVEDEPYKLLARDAEKSILAGPLSSPSEQLPFPASLKAPVPPTHDAVTVPVMFGRTSQENLWRLLTFPSALKMVPFELGQLKTAQTKKTTAGTCSISTHQTQIARMVRRKQYSLRRFDWSNASNFDA